MGACNGLFFVSSHPDGVSVCISSLICKPKIMNIIFVISLYDGGNFHLSHVMIK